MFFTSSCNKQKVQGSEKATNEIKSFVASIDQDFKFLEEEILKIGDSILVLYQNRDDILANGDKNKFVIDGPFANSGPDEDPDLSTLYISTKGEDWAKIQEMIILTNPLDEVFKQVISKHEVITQVYFNSSVQLNRLYPPYDARTMLDHDLDVTSFNFYYEADEKHNPSKSLVWVEEIYVDPVGKGWVLSLLNPIYFEDELKMVLAFDISINSILENYLDKTKRQLLIIDQTGTVVAGKPKAIEALSLPPLKNHTYIQTITSDSFRPEEYNLFKSKSREVRKMISSFILSGNETYVLNEGMDKITVNVYNMDNLNWMILDVVVQ
ncbi:Cache sensor protein [Belliella sp. R4-6]|uniref:Cache sensor protein n=1 Tax=Belliella alkalica TaxID=1730871 RepID=A0ABS9VE41_9BACT|nr:Cache sensor protein [Belliella alkalica]